MWKLLKHAIPLGVIVHRRIQATSPLCHICSNEEESVEHHALHCQFSRICHFLGPIALKTDALTGSLKDAFILIGSKKDDEQWTAFLNSLWAIW